jgi:hypothetical protein
MSDDWMEEVDVHAWRARCEVLEIASRWVTAQNHFNDGLISWRNYVAVALRTVDPDSVGEGLVRLIPEMEDLTSKHILELHEDNPSASSSFGFQDWLPNWQAHFGHWDDPVRRMLGDICVTPEARFFAERLDSVDGQVLLDFLLCTCCSSLRFLLDPKTSDLATVQQFPLSLDIWVKERMVEQLCRKLYQRFQEVAPFTTAPAPVKINLGLNYDRLCPLEPQNASQRDGTCL